MTSRHSRRDILIGAGGIALASPLFGLVACDGGAGTTTRLAGRTMGTGYHVTVAGTISDAARTTLRAEIEAALDTVEDGMSTWRASSEISRFNTGGPDDWTPISVNTATVIAEARRLAAWSGGAFDPTVGPLVDLWGFGAGSLDRRIPPRERIGDVLQGTGVEFVRTEAAATAIAKQRPGIALDLSGIAKGFGVDRVAEHLERRGIGDYLVEIGGELKARGLSPRGRPWRIGIERPVAGKRSVQRIVGLDRGGIATSGNYRNFFEHAGTRYSHILDPRTGAPIDHDLASVTVIAPTTMRADALSTALMVLGADAGMRLARRDDIAALFIVAGRARLVEVASPAFDAHGAA